MGEARKIKALERGGSLLDQGRMFARQYFMHMGTFCAEACGDSDESWFLVISIFWQ
jgi:hypothetical protein